MGAHRIFFQGEGKFRDALFSSKKLTTFLVVTLKTQVFNVTANAQNTLQHFQGASARSLLPLPAGTHATRTDLSTDLPTLHFTPPDALWQTRLYFPFYNIKAILLANILLQEKPNISLLDLAASEHKCL